MRHPQILLAVAFALAGCNELGQTGGTGECTNGALCAQPVAAAAVASTGAITNATGEAASDGFSATSFSPAAGPVGTLLTITGANLSRATFVTVGGVAATIVSTNASGTQLVILVMPGTTSGSVTAFEVSGSSTAVGTFTVTATGAPTVQEAGPLVVTGAIGSTPLLGYAVALSADGNTALFGAPLDGSGSPGAAFVFTRIAGSWSQQAKLVGSGALGTAYQGVSVALSADGNTALVGGYGDTNFDGAVWVFTRSGTTWTQQGGKLMASDSVGSSYVGASLGLSADGNTALVGGYGDNGFAGAAWIFARDSDGAWSQVGSKLVGTGASGAASQGHSVALSSDGETALIGAPSDNSDTGAAWVFANNGQGWSQQGSKLVPTGASGTAEFGYSAALSADGNTALIGGPFDAINVGAAWVFTRSATRTWSQQTKLVGSGNVGSEQAIGPIGLSANGNVAIVGGPRDSNVGAFWIFTRSGTTWSQLGSKYVPAGGSAAEPGYCVAISSDATTAAIGGPIDDGDVGTAWIYFQ